MADKAAGDHAELVTQPSPPNHTESSFATSLSDGVWTIAQVAQAFGVTHRTVRHYEAQGLLAPARRGTQRLYHARDRVRLELVLRGRRLGFGLDQIRRIVDMYDSEVGERGQIHYLLSQIELRRAELVQRRRDIDITLAELDNVERRARQALE